MGYPDGSHYQRRTTCMAIIAAVRKQRPLWDSSQDNRNRPDFMRNLWSEVAAEVGGEAPHVRARWKTLRHKYGFSYREHVRTGLRPNWQYYQAMSFLSPILEKAVKGEEKRKSANKDGLNGATVEEDAAWDDVISQDLQDDANDTSSKSREHEPNDQVIVISPASCLIDIQQAEIEIADSPEITQPMKIPRVVVPSEATTSTSFISHSSIPNGKTRPKNISQSYKHAHGNDSDHPSINGWLDIERRKLELLEKEVAEESNPDLNFFKSLLPAMKFFSESQKLRVRMSINQIILSEYSKVKTQAANNCFLTKK